MNVKGFFKNVISGDAEANPSPKETEGGMSGFFSGTSKFLDSVQSKKNGLFNDLSNKLNSIKLPAELSGSKVKKAEAEEAGDDGSSASEYGDEGDKPMYAEQSLLERTVSVESVDSLPENEGEQCKMEIKTLLTHVLQQRPVTSEMKANFHNFAMHHTGRSAFAKELRKQSEISKEVSPNVLSELGQYLSHILVHCNENEDFSPAAKLMQSSFTLYKENKATNINQRSEQIYLFTLLMDQPIWQSMRFWNAAFFIALQFERRNQPIPPGLRDEDALNAEKEIQENAAFVQLSKFIWRMKSLGITKEACSEFLRKHSSAENLPKDACKTLQVNLNKIFQSEEDIT